MNRSFNRAFASLLTGAVLLAALVMGLKGGNVNAAPGKPAVPSGYSWNDPINVTQGGSFYDNAPSIAADQLDHTVSVGWTRTEEGGTAAFITQASRGILSGYACGGPGEPCAAGNKPYFRPNVNVTRRQAAKIVYGGQQQP